MLSETPKSALILSGGGARAAYQVGVLKAMMDILPSDCGNPFPILCGTSAGAINATVLAAYAARTRIGVKRLETVWANFHTHHIYRSDLAGITRNTLRWMGHVLFNAGEPNSVTMLDNAPLRRLLKQVIPFARIQEAVQNGALYALSITASGYTSGESISFFQGGPQLESWQRHRRAGAKAVINLNHVMASAALPLIFPAVKVNREYFGDGSMRFLAPISPALHLGADQVMVVGVDPLRKLPPDRRIAITPPTIAQVAGHILDSIFIDSLEGDLERLQRINRTVGMVPPEELNKHGIPLKPVKTLVIAPSEDISVIAGKHAAALPPTLRFLFGRIGASATSGSTVLSYLMFEAPFCRDLIELGHADALRQKDSIREFFGHLF
ncbi:MAG: patatin-like phospholipase family protein [Gammaproteobacteria bacterium]|nr:patatin-like phospholipase family protein [Gammaproteobacteria bacterium]